MATADPELNAVESALNTLALAESEAALQKAVTRLLPALLSALSTKSNAARAKCIETLQHINVRVRATPNIKLPFNDVLQVATKSDASILTINVAIQGGYLARCFDRLPRSEKASALAPLITASATVSSEGNCKVLQFIAVQALAAKSAEVPSSTSTELWQAISSCRESAIFSFFDFCLHALRMKLKKPVPEAALLAIIRLATQYADLKEPARAARVFPHFLVAAGMSSRSAVISAGENAMKKVDSCDILAEADPAIVPKLFELFVDSLAEVPLRIVVLSKGLLNVTLCASCFPEVLDVIKFSLHTPGIPPRFQALGMQFVSFVIAHADRDVLFQHLPTVITLLMQLADNVTNGSPSFPDAVRAFGFTALGELIVRFPSILGKNRLPTDYLFDAAQSTQQPPAVRSAASQTLIAIARVLKFGSKCSPALKQSVLATLTRTLENRADYAASARSAAVQWANECFPFADCQARLLNIIATADTKQDVRQQGIAGLAPKRWKFKDGTEDSDSDVSSGLEKPSLGNMLQSYITYTNAKQFPKMLEAFLKFSFYIVRYTIVSGGILELSDINSVNRFYEEHEDEKKSLIGLVEIAEGVLSESAGRTANLEKAALSVILFGSKVSSLRSDRAQRFVSRIDDLVKLTTRKSAAGDILVARALATLVAVAADSLSAEEVSDLVENLAKGLEPPSSGVPAGRDSEDERVASILCIGQITANCRWRMDIDLEDTENSPFSKACLDISRRLMLPVETSEAVRSAVCLSLADIGATGPLPIPLASRANFIATLAGVLKLHSTSAKLAQIAADTIGKLCIGEPRASFKRTAGETLLQLCKERKEDEIQFLSAESLCRSVTGFDAPPPASLQEMDSNEDQEVVSSDSDTLQSVLLLRTQPFEVKPALQEKDGNANTSESYDLEAAIQGAIDLSYDERPTARAGGCVCLFTFLRLLGTKSDGGVGIDSKISFRSPDDEARFKEQQNCLEGKLEDIQRAFTVLLGDRSEFIQQLSSCGVALVYQMCPTSGQRDLVSALVRSLTSGKAKSAATVPGDQGTMLEFGREDVQDGSAGPKSAATYKELCTLAQDMGQPELVYKFMDLAGHAALWNSRKGAALAGSALLGSDLAAEQLRPHLKSLLPRLYVYCYDPTESVRTAMSVVLGAVIKASGLGSVFEAVTEHFELVTQHCLKSMTSRQWRTREAGCGALKDALMSRTWELVRRHLSEFWYYTLRALDDIKETVRKAASGTGRAISELSIHLCDPGHVGVDIARAASAIVIPAVMPGIMHADEMIRTLCSTTMTKLIRYSGEALRPSVASLMGMLLEAASELEPQVLNYAQFHVSDPNVLEDHRVNAASTSSSPLVDSLERLSTLVDESNVEETVRTMMRLAKTGVGIPTRAGTARLFSTILKSRAVVVEPLAGKLMHSAMLASRMELNGTLRIAWCAAAGTAAKLCSTVDVTRFIDRIVALAGSEDERERLQASCLAAGVWRESTDTARQHASALLPIAYMGSYENEDVQHGSGTNWRAVWNEGAPSTESGLRHYAKEITDICEGRLANSSQYNVKKCAAAALGALAEASNESVDMKYMQKAVKSLFEAIPGHIWDGKIAVIEAMGTIGKCYKDLDVWADAGGVERVVHVLLGETKRGKKEYKLAGMESARQVIQGCREKYAVFDMVYDSLQEHWRAVVEGDGNVDGLSTDVSRVVWETGSDANAVDARNKARKAQRALCVVAVSCLEACYGGSEEKNRKFGDAKELDSALQVVESVMKSDWDVRLGALQTLKRMTERSDSESLKLNDLNDGVLLMQRILKVVWDGITDEKYSGVRRGGYECLLALGQAVGDGHTQTVVRHLSRELCDIIVKGRRGDEDSDVQGIAKKVCLMFGLEMSDDDAGDDVA